MKQQFFKTILKTTLASVFVTLAFAVFVLKNAMPFSTRKQVFYLILGMAAVLSVFAALVSGAVSSKLYSDGIRPLRSIVHYLQARISGKLDDTEGSMQTEKELARLIDQEAERKEFLEQMRMVRENDKLRRQFSANVSHELKSPLTSINGYAEMIETGMASPEDAQRFAGIIHREGERLLQMINEIIRLSQFDNGTVEQNEELLNVDEIVRQQIQALGQYAHQHRVELRYHTMRESLSDMEEDSQQAGDFSMLANQRLVSEMVSNLVSNAIKYSKPEGGIVEITLCDAGTSFLFEVKDEGVGIQPEDQERIFERFYVVDPSRSRVEGSRTGLGLALVKHTVQYYGGSIDLKSTPGKGSVFLIHLPK
ncbi:MAG: HAMP domain-containing sensor histidine kinase [Peptoniphilaceae bacterium]|nr:HAMP domain-containing sensor histidine kinase [Peptoniphilaceae bacterium]MDY5765643.1 HAMP domain-containing sensor histidine kinase [Peptoniphilaceae bacterium]